MGYPTTASEGVSISTWGTGGNFYATLLSRLTKIGATLNVTNEAQDATGLDVESLVHIAGLANWNIELEALAFSTPRMGSIGTVAVSGGYVTHVREWEVTFESTQVHDITPLGTAPPSTGPTWQTFRPDAVRITGRVVCLADSATAAALTHVVTDSAVSITVGYGQDVADDTVSGNGFVTQLGAVVRRGDLNQYTYSFVGSGPWTPAGTNSIFGATAFGIPLWSQGGSAAGAIQMDTLTSSRFFSGADSFWSRLTVRNAVNELVQVSASIQGTGALTST